MMDKYHSPFKFGIPIKLQPHTYESFMGFILRLTDENDYNTPRWIFNLINSQEFRFSNAYFRESADLLAQYCDIDKERLLNILFKPISGNFNVFEHNILGKVHSRNLDFERAKICPVCVDEYKSCLLFWDFDFIHTCPHHRRRLISKCNCCGKRITWWRNKLNECKFCKKPFQPGVLVDNADALFQFNKIYLAGLSLPYDIDDISQEWVKYSKYEIQSILNILLKPFLKSKPYASFTVAEKYNLNHKVSKFWQNWPAGFHDFLRSLFQADFKNGYAFSLSPNSHFGQFYIDSQNIDCKIIKDEIEEFIYSSHLRGQISGKGRSNLYTRNKMQKSFLTRSEATARLSISSQTFRRLFKLNVLKGHEIKHGKQKVYRTTVKSIEDYENNVGISIGFSELIDFLGINKNFMSCVIKAGYVSAFSGKPIDGAQSWKFLPSEVEKIYSALDASYTPAFLPYETLGKLTDCYQILARHGLKMTTYIDLIFQGKVKPRFVNEKRDDLNRYEFCLWEFIPYLNQSYEKKKDKVWISLDLASNCLGITTSVLLELGTVHSGILPIYKHENINGFFIKDMSGFIDRYIAYNAFVRAIGDWRKADKELLKIEDIEWIKKGKKRHYLLKLPDDRLCLKKRFRGKAKFEMHHIALSMRDG